MARAVHRPRPSSSNRPSAAVPRRVGPSTRVLARASGRRRWGRRARPALRARRRPSPILAAARRCAMEVCRAGGGEVPTHWGHGSALWKLAAPGPAKFQTQRGVGRDHGGLPHRAGCKAPGPGRRKAGEAACRSHSPRHCAPASAVEPARGRAPGARVRSFRARRPRATPPDAGTRPVQRGRAGSRLGQPGPDKAVLDKATIERRPGLATRPGRGRHRVPGVGAADRRTLHGRRCIALAAHRRQRMDDVL